MKKTLLTLFVLVTAFLPVLTAQESKADGSAATTLSCPKAAACKALQAECKNADKAAACAEKKALCANTECKFNQDGKCTRAKSECVSLKGCAKLDAACANTECKFNQDGKCTRAKSECASLKACPKLDAASTEAKLAEDAKGANCAVSKSEKATQLGCPMKKGCGQTEAATLNCPKKAEAIAEKKACAQTEAATQTCPKKAEATAEQKQ